MQFTKQREEPMDRDVGTNLSRSPSLCHGSSGGKGCRRACATLPLGYRPCTHVPSSLLTSSRNTDIFRVMSLDSTFFMRRKLSACTALLRSSGFSTVRSVLGRRWFQNFPGLSPLRACDGHHMTSILHELCACNQVGRRLSDEVPWPFSCEVTIAWKKRICLHFSNKARPGKA